jgi:hypothetical protein
MIKMHIQFYTENEGVKRPLGHHGRGWNIDILSMAFRGMTLIWPLQL